MRSREKVERVLSARGVKVADVYEGDMVDAASVRDALSDGLDGARALAG